MKNKLLKMIIMTLVIVNYSYSQCNPITIPQINPDNGYGGAFCLQGSTGSPTIEEDNMAELCLNNINGNFVISKKEFSDTNPKTKLTLTNSNLSLVGLNPPSSFFNLSFDFDSAGSAIIRSQRGNSWDTKLQFLTNHPDGGSGSIAYPPIPRMTIDSGGRVGINTENPNYILDVFGDAKFTDENLNDGKLVIKGSNTPNYIYDISNNTKRDLSFEFSGAGSSKVRSFRGGEMDTYLQFLTNSKTDSDNPQIRMHINEDGNIGIGTITPKSKLEVIGNVIIGEIPSNKMPNDYNLYVEKGVIAEKVKVAVLTSSQWSDHVFDKKYELKPLEEVEKYIEENKHLPNIPSSEELVKEGLDLGKMQAKQMEKIEELTLYLIEMKKEIDILKKENKELKKIISNN